MKKILVAYATFSGSTVEVAQLVGEELSKHDVLVEVLPISEVKDLDDYDGVVLGGPMIMGWHRAALKFLKANRKAFERIPHAVFVMCMSLTQTGDTSVGGVPVVVDKNLPKAPKKAGRLNLRERYANLSSYIKPIINATHPWKPASIGVFGGRLEYGRLKWWAVLFVMLIVQAPAGDRRNWEDIRSWAVGLPEAFEQRQST